MKKIKLMIIILFLPLLVSCTLIPSIDRPSEGSSSNISEPTTNEESSAEESSLDIYGSSISDVKNGPIGDTYVTAGYVCAINNTGYLITDKNGEYLYVYTESLAAVSTGDLVQVTGASSSYGGAVQIAKGSSFDIISSNHQISFNARKYTAADLNNYLNNVEVGIMASITGTLNIVTNSTGEFYYYNIEVEGLTGAYVSIISSSIDLSELNGKKIKVEGYLVYVSGSNAKYINISPLSVAEIKEEKPLPSGTQTLSIIEMNDVHGYIMQDDNQKYGISNMAYLINNIRDDVGADNVLLIANGDMFQGTALVRMSMGEVMIEVMNAMNFDACCLGNHEFDWDLPTILNYFDGDSNNGEADFPLINANVFQDGQLVTIDGGKIFESQIFEKAGVKVGFIGYIGDVKSSINALYADKYSFDTDFASSVLRIGSGLKEAGCDIIVVSVHDGNTSGVEYYSVNQDLASLTYNGQYLVDAVINGHTHSYQSGAISRTNGVDMPVIQSNGYAGGYLYSCGVIDLEIDMSSKAVVGYNTYHLEANQAGTNYDISVQNIVDEYYQRDIDTLEAVYCYNEEYIDRYASSTREWVANVMLSATGADIAICNTGGLRSGINSGNIGFVELYEMNPFDNEIILHECSASTINNFIKSSYYFYNTSTGSLKTSGTYTVAVIDYVFYSSYYSSCRSSVYTDTDLILRDALIADLKLRDTIKLSESTEAKVGLMINSSSKYVVRYDMLLTDFYRYELEL